MMNQNKMNYLKELWNYHYKKLLKNKNNKFNNLNKEVNNKMYSKIKILLTNCQE